MGWSVYSDREIEFTIKYKSFEIAINVSFFYHLSFRIVKNEPKKRGL
jgi:hypothetical protein